MKIKTLCFLFEKSFQNDATKNKVFYLFLGEKLNLENYEN